jgi:hypothetical protein
MLGRRKNLSKKNMEPSKPCFSHFWPLWWYTQTWLNWSKIEIIDGSLRRRTLRLERYRDAGDMRALGGWTPAYACCCRGADNDADGV